MLVSTAKYWLICLSKTGFGDLVAEDEVGLTQNVELLLGDARR